MGVSPRRQGSVGAAVGAADHGDPREAQGLVQYNGTMAALMAVGDST